MWKNSLLTGCLLLGFFAQGQIGNEWIDPNQSYYKLKIIEDGYYRVTAAELASIGFPLESVSASNIQLFRRGEEVALTVNPTSGAINYIEFYGLANDGTGDESLYESGNQPHDRRNLFSDTASYFLTYKLGSETGKRMAFSSDKNTTGLTPETYHLAEETLLFSDEYASGIKFGLGSAFSLSKYDEGEGWTGPFQSKNVAIDFNFQLDNFENATVDPTLTTVIVGGNSLGHNAQLLVGESAGSLSSLTNVDFVGWGFELFEGTFNANNVGAGGDLVVRVNAEGYPSTSERLSVAFMSVLYPQTIQMGTTENKLFRIDSPTEAKSWLQIQTTNASGTRVFDVSDPFNVKRLAKTNFSNRVDVVVPGVTDGHKILAVTTPLTVPEMKAVTVPQFDLSTKDYLIITHEQLESDGNPIESYANYRRSSAGGVHQVQIATTRELYDLYNYGDPSPLAIRNFIIDANNQHPIDNVFLIGKGYTPNYDRFRTNPSEINVPTYGLPGSDLLYVAGIGTDPDLPGIPIGRLNALTTTDVYAYLDKVVEMEAQPFDDLYRKDFLQLSGGINSSEINTFISFVQGFTNVLEQDFIGGRAFNTGKETSNAVEYLDVTDRVNQGVGYITFFGHSSGTVTDIEIGRVGDPSFGFANKGKYPIFLVNGCKAGEIFGTNFTFGEDWMSEPDLGAIGFIAHSDVALSTTLKRWSDLYYSMGFGDETFIGSTLGEIMNAVSGRYYSLYGGGSLSLTQIQQMTLQGDPAYRLFGAEMPDYHIDSNALSAFSIEGGEILSVQDSFKIEIEVKNFGRTVQDSLVIQLNRTLPDGGQLVYVEEFVRPLRQDTLVVYIPNDPTQKNDGINLFTVLLDPANLVDELDETNNSATLSVAIYNGNTVNLYPLDNGTQSSQQVEFIWQSSNLLEEERSYELEFDTNPNFISPNNRIFTVSGEVLASRTFDFSSFTLPDTSTIYWRTRFADTDSDETNEWVQSSFTLINGIGEGWGQYDAEQAETAIISGVEYNQLTNQWDFIESTTPIDIFTYGADNASFTYNDLRSIIGGVNFFVTSNTIDPLCEVNTFNAIAFDKESGAPYRPIETTELDVYNREVCGRLPQRIYQFRETDMIDTDRLQVLVDNMRDGDKVVLFTIGEVLFSNWDAAVETTLNSLGIDNATLGSLVDGQPVIFLGEKGAAPGTATMIINDGSPDPPREQSIELQADVIGSFISGEIRSRRIGPAKSWDAFSFNVSEELNDNIGIDVYGVDPNGNLTSLASRSRAETISVAGTDAIVFPQIEVSYTFGDATDQTPPQFNFWEINYEYPPEGLLLTHNKDVSTVQEGEAIERRFSFYNLSDDDFTDSLMVMATLVNQKRGESVVSSFKVGPPVAADSTTFDVFFSSSNLDGPNSLVVEVMPSENEVYSGNNRITLTNLINVLADETNPVLDVTFDGYHILDGDIVAPDPNIVIRMKDDNAFINKKDTIGVNLSLRLPGQESQFQRVNFSDPRLSYTPAGPNQDFQMEYNPGPLDDGVYSLRVQAEDEAGNEAGTEPYEINFEVINESTITHFYPYPNPFSTRCRFVFTLTGSEIPDEIKIQILTVTGRVVREITQDEIGPLRIGNNITTYAWDGRDEFGDQLANGVYFYKVFINSGGRSMQRRTTSADRAFKHGFGKLYILR